MNLFLSYAHKNTDLAKSLAAVLTKGGQTVWWDDQLRVGPRWLDQLSDQIQHSDAIVLALTPAWIESAFCQWEFITAAEQGKQVIPVLLAHHAAGSPLIVPNRISEYQWADFTGGFQNSATVQKFLDDLLGLAVTLKASDVSHLNKNAYTISINKQQNQNSGPQITQTNQSGHNFNVSGSGNVVSGGNIDQSHTITTHGPISGGNVVIGGKQNVSGNLTINMGGLSAADDNRKHLQALIEQLNAALVKLPTHEQEMGEDVAVLAQEVVQEAGKENPRGSMLKIKGENLVQAAKNLLTVAPIAVEIAKILTLIK